MQDPTHFSLLLSDPLLLRVGQPVLFPSCVNHEVLAFQGEGERFMVAFNCWFKLADAADARGPY